MNNKSSNSQTIIAEDVQIDGDMVLIGNITIYGEIRGSVSTDGAIQLARKETYSFCFLKNHSGKICTSYKSKVNMKIVKKILLMIQKNYMQISFK